MFFFSLFFLSLPLPTAMRGNALRNEMIIRVSTNRKLNHQRIRSLCIHLRLKTIVEKKFKLRFEYDESNCEEFVTREDDAPVIRMTKRRLIGI